jgi:hypothetical protein
MQSSNANNAPSGFDQRLISPKLTLHQDYTKKCLLRIRDFISDSFYHQDLCTPPDIAFSSTNNAAKITQKWTFLVDAHDCSKILVSPSIQVNLSHAWDMATAMRRLRQAPFSLEWD